MLGFASHSRFDAIRDVSASQAWSGSPEWRARLGSASPPRRRDSPTISFGEPLTLYLSIGFMLEAATRMKIGEVADRGGVNLQTIRYYEREGLLPQPPRLPSGYRVYTQPTVRRVRFIKRAQELGFTLAEIRELLSLRLDRVRDRSDVRA